MNLDTVSENYFFCFFDLKEIQEDQSLLLIKLRTSLLLVYVLIVCCCLFSNVEYVKKDLSLANSS